VVVRGQEDQGVRLFELNKTNFEQVASILVEEDEYGDCTDIVRGRDFIVEGYSEINPQTNKTYTAITVKPSVKQTPLSDDPELVKKWLIEQYVPIEQYKRYTKEEIKQIYESFLNPADGSDDADETPKPKAAPLAPAKPPKAAFKKVEEVEAEEEQEEAPKPKAKVKAKDPDDLPFEQDETPAPKAKAKVVVKDLDEDDELSAQIPKTKPAAAAPKAKPAPAAKPESIKSKFSAAFDDDDDQE
jgi:hypothetical protein